MPQATGRRVFQHLLNRSNSVQHVLHRKRRMDEEHQARLAQLSRCRQSVSRPPILGKCFFEVDLATTTAKAWNPFRNYRLQ
jgi:hypothetical protein